MIKRRTFIALIVILQLFTQLLNVECRPEAKKGKGKAFGAGILAGGLAGAAMGHILTRQNGPTEVHHHHHMVGPNAAASNPVVPAVASPAPRPSVIIERGETLANGCYKQIIKEPNVYDVTRFIETAQLICPPNSPVQPTYVQQEPAVPVVSVPHAQPQPISPAVPMIPVAIPASPSVLPVATDNVTPPQLPAEITPNTETVYTAPVVPFPPTPLEGQQNQAAAPIIPVIQQQFPQPTQSTIPAIVPPPSSVPGQVIVLSKKTGFYEEDKIKKNSASNLLVIHFGLMLLLAIGLCFYI